MFVICVVCEFVKYGIVFVVYNFLELFVFVKFIGEYLWY